MKKYKGQALAIVLIILIVGVIVAFGIASRTNKNVVRNIDEKKSQDASEVVNSSIDVSRSILTNDIINNCTYEFGQKQECCITFDGSTISKDFSNLPSSTDFPRCTYSSNSQDYTKICFKPEYDVEDYTLKKDEVLDFAFTSQSISTTSCSSLNFTFTKIGGAANSSIVTSKIFSKRDPFGEVIDYKVYEDSDISNHVLTNSDLNWSFLGAEFVKPAYPLYPIDDLRIRAVGSDVKVNMKANNCNMEPFFIKVTTSANCSGSFRSSYYYRPLQNPALSLFDFVIYNKNGDLKFAN
jgi:hypothetical protein